MIAVRRLLFVGAVLAATSATATTALLGDQGSRSATVPSSLPANLGKLAERYSEAKFLLPGSGVHTYQAAGGERYFALKLQPALTAAPATARDIVILVDSTASQAGLPWQTAKAMVKLLAAQAGAEDRISISTIAAKVNPLTSGLIAAKDAKVAESVTALDQVVPLGAADLKSGLQSASTLLAGSAGRQKIVCYIGDGASVLSPLQSTDRQSIAGDMLGKEIQFFAVPVGYNPDVLDLSGIATATGGAILRLAPSETPEATVARFHKTFSAPILRDPQAAFPQQVSLALPGKLPPLRGDTPTLVVGKLSGELKELTVSCQGTVGGQRLADRNRSARLARLLFPSQHGPSVGPR
jgi:hypothetical protein